MDLSEQGFHKWFAVAGIVLLNAGCSTTINETSGGVIKETRNNLLGSEAKPWQAVKGDLLTQGEVVNGNWWTTFKDPQLNQLVNQAVGQNYQVWKTQAQVAQTRAQAVIAGAERLPSLAASSTGYKVGNSDNESYTLNLTVSWEIDLWNRLQAQSLAARENYLASHESLRAVRQSIAAQTAKAYFAVVASKQQVALSKKTLGVLQETARQIGNRADVGIASPTDKHLSIANLQSATAGLASREEALARGSRQLQLLLTEYPDGRVQTANHLAQLPALPKLGIPAGLLSRRPDVLTAEKQLRAAGFNVFSAQKSLWPSFSLSTSTVPTGVGFASSQLSNLLKGDFSYWSLAGALVQPIFQGGKLRANVQLKQAAQQAAANTYAQTALTAFGEVESALAARGLISRRQQALCSAANASQQAERVSLNRYQQGLEPYLTVLESQQRALSAAGSCITARYDALINYIDLQLALGGGFDQRVEPASTQIIPQKLTQKLTQPTESAQEH
jgi:NodT family efflux transporter outer membrane factor (OMF) lipoprotein